MDLYIYHNLYQNINYMVVKYDQFIQYTSGTACSLGSSYLNAETPTNLNGLHLCNSGNMVKTPEVSSEINDLDSGAFQCGGNEKKYKIFNSILEINTSTARFPELLHSEADKSSVIAALDLDGVVLCADYHEAANANYLTVPFIFKIPKDELSKYNGPDNFRNIFIKKVNNLTSDIRKNYENIRNYTKK